MANRKFPIRTECDGVPMIQHRGSCWMYDRETDLANKAAKANDQEPSEDTK